MSRASKSSTSFYLANLGLRVANVPLVPGLPPLPQLGKLPADKVIGLRVNVTRLMSVREGRASGLRLRAGDPYLDQRAIAREVLEADRIMEERGWQSIDASYLAIEEIAREVLALAGIRPGRRATAPA